MKMPAQIAQLQSLVSEDEPISCVVCHEGYIKKPTELLGVYLYTKSYPIKGNDTIGSATVSKGYSSVTYFNAIHL